MIDKGPVACARERKAKRARAAALLLAGLALVFGTEGSAQQPACGTAAAQRACTFDEDRALLQAHDRDLVELRGPDGMSRVLVSPRWQGRVMTSTFADGSVPGNGWINRDYIQAGTISPQFNPFGGEDRFWLGPEGGQFAFYFPPGQPFEIENWKVPAVIDTEPFPITARTSTSATFERRFSLTNYSGNRFDMRVTRAVRLLPARALPGTIGMRLPRGVRFVGYETRNTLANAGRTAWTRETGAPSIWILGMFTASPSNTVAIPLRPAPGGDSRSGVNSSYFGEVPPDRLVVRDNALFLRADARMRSKIGVAPHRAMPFLASYDPDRRVLTVVQYTLPRGVTSYVNSEWKLQPNPFGGDAANAYNDGPLPNGQQLGNFYELESSSPAAFLRPGQSMTHVHRTFHFSGEPAALDRIARRLLNIPLREIERAFSDQTARP